MSTQSKKEANKRIKLKYAFFSCYWYGTDAQSTPRAWCKNSTEKSRMFLLSFSWHFWTRVHTPKYTILTRRLDWGPILPAGTSLPNAGMKKNPWKKSQKDSYTVQQRSLPLNIAHLSFLGMTSRFQTLALELKKVLVIPDLWALLDHQHRYPGKVLRGSNLLCIPWHLH